MNALMRRLRPASFAWLVLHEIRLARRAMRRRKLSLAIGLVLLVAYTAAGVAIALGLRDVAIVPDAMMLTGALVASVLLMSFMSTQALLGSQRTIYDSGDLDLLLSAPIEPRIVLLAKLAGIAASVVLAFALLVLPIALPTALLGHPGLLGIPALIVAAALVSTCFGLAVMLGVAALAGPRAARTLGQVVAALLGGAIFILSQLFSHQDSIAGRRSSGLALFHWFTEHHVGTGGIGALPGRAAFGDPVAIAILLGAALVIFAATGLIFGRAFLSSWQGAGIRLSPRRGAAASDKAIARHFHAGLGAAMFAKEWRLLARDPALAFQIVLRLIYMAPLALVAFNHGGSVAPTLAFISVIIAGQVVGSLSWIAISAEDAPDLITVAPVDKAEAERAKLTAAFAMGAPLALALPIAIAFTSLPGALVTLAATGVGGLISGWIELKWQKPAPRSTFIRRRSGSVVSSLLTFIVTAILGATAAGIVWLLTM
jgi:ABC-2 type transport system permease protein